MSLALLTTVPEAVSLSLSLQDRLDRALGAGLSRLDPAGRDEVSAFAAAFAGTPLEPALVEAVEAVHAGAILDRHLVALAAARASLQAALHDALLAQAAEATGLSIELDAPPVEAPTAAPPEDENLRHGVRQWLLELGLAGFRQIEAAAVVPAAATLEAVRNRGTMPRLAAMLAGFIGELMDHVPTSALQEVPLRRWADLWTRALLLAHAGPEAPEAMKVSGRFTPMGVDLRHHDNVVSAVVYGVLEADGQREAARVSAAAWRVDAIAGPEQWLLLQDQLGAIIPGLVEGKAVELANATRLSTGELLLDGSAKAGGSADPFKLDLSGLRLPAMAARDRHPIQIAIPIVLPEIEVDGSGKAIKVGDATLPLALDRVSSELKTGEKGIKSALKLVGLLRWDGGWSVQPLQMHTSGRNPELIGPVASLAAAAKVKGPAVTTLRSFAGKLLRKS